jgi:hypothetical protein
MNKNEKRAILLGFIDLGESFLPENGPAEIAERHERFAELRSAAEQLAEIPDETLIQGLWGAVQFEHGLLRSALAVGVDSLDYAEEIEGRLDRITGARSRANIARRKALRQRVVDLREAGEKVDYVARLLNVTPRYVTELTPEYLKGRR